MPGLRGHTLASAPTLGKRERYLMRTGKISKKERIIVMLREQRRALFEYGVLKLNTLEFYDF